MLNPEFKRNMWSELSFARLIGMPLILAVVFLIAHLMANTKLGDGSYLWAGVNLYIVPFTLTILLIFWGTRLASEAAIQEVRQGTWWFQVTSTLGPWRMTWGKLFGATVYVWYGAFFCLLYYIFQKWGEVPLERLAFILGVHVLTGVFAQALSLLSSLYALQWRHQYGRFEILFHQLIGVLSGLGLLRAVLFSSLPHRFNSMVQWYEWSLPYPLFVVIGFLFALFWSVLGVYALMRLEMQRDNPPWFWLAFVASLVVALIGVKFNVRLALILPVPVGALVAFAFALAAVYLTACGEPKDAVRLRMLRNAAGEKRYKRALALFPRSFLTIPVVLGVTVYLIMNVKAPTFFFKSDGEMAAFVVALKYCIFAAFLFMLRDVLFIYVMSMMEKTRLQGDNVFAVLALLLSYSLFPAIFIALEMDVMVGVFLPWAQDDYAFILMPVIGQCLFVAWYFYHRWEKNTADR